jgi:hypothetical protein
VDEVDEVDEVFVFSLPSLVEGLERKREGM